MDGPASAGVFPHPSMKPGATQRIGREKLCEQKQQKQQSPALRVNNLEASKMFQQRPVIGLSSLFF